MRNTGEIIINESDFTLDNGSNALMLFCIIAHEVVHRLVEYNLQYFRIEESYRIKLDNLKNKGITPETKKVDEYIELVLKNQKYNETEAFQFEYKIFHEFFKGIIVDRLIKFELNGKPYAPSMHMLEFTQSYLQSRGVYNIIDAYVPNEERKTILSEANAAIMQNLNYIISGVQPIEDHLARINTGQYDDFKDELYKEREEMLKPNNTP
jgi:hypothetical protein